MSEATLNGAAFKELIDGVKRFPSIGSFLGSDLINLRVTNKEAVASAFGVVVSRVTTAAAGELPLSAIDERAIIPFSAICTAKSDVKIKVVDKALLFSTRGREITAANTTGQDHKIGDVGTLTPIQISKDLASEITYLADIAMNDSSRPDLCCVMLTNQEAMACDQKAIVVLKCSIKVPGKVALPLAIARAMQTGDALYVGAKETVLASGIGRYAMPSPVKAQKDFPVDKIKRLSAIEKKPVALVAGEHLKSALEECSAVLSNIARNEVVVQLDFANGKLELSAKNGGVKFHRWLPVKEKRAAGLNVPLDKALSAAQLFESNVLTVAEGMNGEACFSCKAGWSMFPRWKSK